MIQDTLIYHKSREVLHYNCEKPRAYYIPYHDAKTAFEDNRAYSKYYKNLCGDWDFAFYATPRELPEFTSEDFTEFFEKVTVPGSWQTYLGRGYDTPNYTNVNFPFPYDPPHVPDDNPCALYKRCFDITAEQLENKDIFINFEGVDSCFYLYINNTFAAYSQVAHMTSEIDITKYLKVGENEIKVLVFKWCDGSYLEDQDKFRFSGIFRETFLLFREKNRIIDYFIKPVLSNDFKQGRIVIDYNIKGAVDIAWKLTAPCGCVVASGKGFDEPIELDEVTLWSDEDPALYTLEFTAGAEYFCEKVGFKRIEVIKGIVYLNGKKIKLKGVNRHDSHPFLGSVTPMEHMYNDIMIFKRHNVNCVRTSHYPNDPRFLKLCDKYGILVVDEADAECHGVTSSYSYDTMAQDPEWITSFVDRAILMLERDKNRPSIIMWSLGNEAGYGICHMEMSKYIKSRDTSRLIHYERCNVSRHNMPQQVEYVDIESRMYTSPAKCLEYLKDKRYDQPLYLCEYCHAMGNGPGDLKDYWDIIWANDNFLGGCIWEYTDHSVAIELEPGKYGYTYGGDFGDYPNDGCFCVDGLVYPDRRPHTGFVEAKYIYAPLHIKTVDAKAGKFSVKNMRFFEKADDMYLRYSVKVNAKTVSEGKISTDIKPHATKQFTVDIPKYNDTDFVFVDFEIVQKVGTEWAPEGYVMGGTQAEINVACVEKKEACPEGCVTVVEDGYDVCITAGDTVYTFDKFTGLLADVYDNGKKLIENTVRPDVWRAPIDNDRNVCKHWKKIGYASETSKCYSAKLTHNCDKCATFEADIAIGGKVYTPVARVSLKYTVYADATLKVEQNVTPVINGRRNHEDSQYLPRYGMVFVMPKGTEQFTYFGKGPGESYVDKNVSTHVDLFKTTVTDNFEPYVRPQENSSHVDTRFAKVYSRSGHGLMFAFENPKGGSVNAQHYSSRQLSETAHDYELVPDEKTFVSVDYMMSGVGSNSCGPQLDPKYRLKHESFSYTFYVKPVFANNTDDFKEYVEMLEK